MKKIKLFTIMMVFFGIVGLTACSHFKSGNEEQKNAQASGIGEEEGFADESSSNRLKAPYNQTYHFDLNKYDVKQEDMDSINAQASYLVTHRSAKVRLEGNADERGSREYNITLGWKRAKAVGAILKQQGVSDAQIAMVSYGKEKPIVAGHDETAYSQNRRVDLVYEAK